MAVINSAISRQSGVHMLVQLLERDAETGRRFGVSDRDSAAYLWSRSVAEQYPQHIPGPDPNAGFEQLAGRVMDLLA